LYNALLHGKKHLSSAAASPQGFPWQKQSYNYAFPRAWLDSRARWVQ
jgi:hypothetical protein